MSATPGRIGLVYSDYTHATIYAHYMQALGWTIAGASAASNVWTPAELEALQEPFPGIRLYPDLDELIGASDALICCNADYRLNVDLARKAAAAGKPLFLDKPACGTVADVQALRTLILAGARIFLGSSFPYSPTIIGTGMTMHRRGFETLHLYGSQEFFEHGIHCTEVAGHLLCSPPAAVEAVRLTDAILVQATYENGAQVKFFLEGPGYMFAVVFSGAGGWCGQTLDNSSHSDCHFARKAKVFDALARGAAADLTFQHHLDGILVLIAAQKSLDQGGGEIRLRDLAGADGFDSRSYARQYALKRRRASLVDPHEKAKLLQVLDPPPPPLMRRIVRKLLNLARRIPGAVWRRIRARLACLNPFRRA
jgi:hypothetical protein